MCDETGYEKNLPMRPGDDQNVNLPAILAGHKMPGVAGRVHKFYLSASEIFEAWVRRCHSPHTRWAYRADVMSFVEFVKIEWPKDSTKMLQMTIPDVLDWRGLMLESGMAPKTTLRRISSLSAFYKYLSAAAVELRIPITVPNPAHAQFASPEVRLMPGKRRER